MLYQPSYIFEMAEACCLQMYFAFVNIFLNLIPQMMFCTRPSFQHSTYSTCREDHSRFLGWHVLEKIAHGWLFGSNSHSEHVPKRQKKWTFSNTSRQGPIADSQYDQWLSGDGKSWRADCQSLPVVQGGSSQNTLKPCVETTWKFHFVSWSSRFVWW